MVEVTQALIDRLRSGASMLKQAGFAFDREHRAMTDAADALTTAQAEAEALKQRIAELEKVIREVGRKAWGNPDSRTCQEIEALVRPLLSENGNG